MQKQSEEVVKDSEYVDMKLNSGTWLANHLHKTQQQKKEDILNTSCAMRKVHDPYSTLWFWPSFQEEFIRSKE